MAEAEDSQVFAVVERVVLALNAVNDLRDGAAYETDEREALCDYIDEALTKGCPVIRRAPAGDYGTALRADGAQRGPHLERSRHLP
ncbi:hypothetical protein [Streptomyces vinaceus]|uniref:hypothetical protein n=1 Tax=Streptomyces vinaceus TaxID=1960 RepID=UPI00369ECF50